jgi:hypothetical protein
MPSGKWTPVGNSGGADGEVDHRPSTPQLGRCVFQETAPSSDCLSSLCVGSPVINETEVLLGDLIKYRGERIDYLFGCISPSSAFLWSFVSPALRYRGP